MHVISYRRYRVTVLVDYEYQKVFIRSCLFPEVGNGFSEAIALLIDR